MPVSMASFNEPQHHTIDRFAIKEVICRKCYTRQSSKTNNCINCGIQFGEYHCAICNLWMDSAERPYHCADCGFCRVGGAENFRHCQDCGMCIDASLFAQHNCKVGKYMQNCPICQEDLFSSRSASHEMPCGHAIHWHCFRELAAHDSRCPVCKKTAETHERMQPTWNAMAMGIELQPVPPDLAKAVTIMCNDCERTDEDRAWHFLGVQCRSCTSFNTVVERITRVGADAHAFLSRVDPHPSQRQAAVEAEAARVQHGQQQQHQQQEHEQGQQPLPPDEMVPSDEQERLFREQQEYQARYIQMRRQEQEQPEQMRREHGQQQPGSRRMMRDGVGRRRSMDF
jgi:RING finger/CHY zinc finger protein 1